MTDGEGQSQHHGRSGVTAGYWLAQDSHLGRQQSPKTTEIKRELLHIRHGVQARISSNKSQRRSTMDLQDQSSSTIPP